MTPIHSRRSLPYSGTNAKLRQQTRTGQRVGDASSRAAPTPRAYTVAAQLSCRTMEYAHDDAIGA